MSVNSKCGAKVEILTDTELQSLGAAKKQRI